MDLAALATRLPPRPLTRFAPSPTGLLHLGHIVNAVYVWGIARALGGRVALRVEDHDRERSRAEYERALFEDLEWLDLEVDEIAIGGEDRVRVVRQSDRDAVYSGALQRLRAQDLVYGCVCSRKRIAEAAGDGTEPRYPGTCRDAGAPLEPGTGVRVQIAPGIERFHDARLGWQSQDPAAQCGDLLIRDRLGQWTYHFAVVVDDAEMHVDLVIRGEDLLASTGRQLALARLLGRSDPPVFLHHPLVFRAPGVKLSKSSGDTGVRELRAAGWTAAAVLGRAAHACGLLPRPSPVEPAALAGLFLQPPS